MHIIGISAFYHDSAATLVTDGQIVAAAQEERFTRVKHDSRFPVNAFRFCMEFAGLEPDDVDYVVFYEKPMLKLNRIMQTFLETSPHHADSFSLAMKEWRSGKLFHKRLLTNALTEASGGSWGSKILFSEHHLSHAASAFYPSPFESAAVLTLDGVGEWATTTLGVGSGSNLRIESEIRFPHSLGLLYAAFTSYTGFKVNSGEYKMMGLAPYGVPSYANLIREHLLDVKDDGSFSINTDYFDYPAGRRMTNSKFHELFGGPPRQPESDITQREMDLAASIQEVTEDVVIRLARGAAVATGEKNLCLAGGVALNCVANGRLLREGIFENIWIQPASGDAGGSTGAALAGYHLALGQPRELTDQRDAMKGSYLGPSFTQDEIKSRLTAIGADFQELDDASLIRETATLLASENVIGWFQGRMEFGPRALGNRSILADPRSPKMQKVLNLKIKFRESFRPFAPSILRERLNDWFNIDVDSPYMLLVANVTEKRLTPVDDDKEGLYGIDLLNVPRSTIPAVTHVDHSARIQTIHAETNPKYHALVKEFERLTGFPVMVNTSFNIRSEPIVNTPEEAFHCFMGTGMDVLVVGNCLMRKIEQNADLAQDYSEVFNLD
ncbi:carbamoyltransferase [Actinomycetota bacterium]|nr:carbamoyltransferase [Actinomycetota bacterium]